METILVKGVTWIGDLVMTIPALSLLRQLRPDSQIIHLGRPWAKDVLEPTGLVDRFLSIERTGNGLSAFLAEARTARSVSPDIAIIFPNSFRSALVAFASGADQRIGYRTDGRGALLNEQVAQPSWKTEQHEVYYYQHLIASSLDSLSSKFDEQEFTLIPPHISLTEQELDQGAQTLRSHSDVNSANAYIALGIGSTNSTAKRWGAQNFAEICSLVSNEGYQPVLLGSEGDRGEASEVVQFAGAKTIDLTGKLSLRESMSVLANCQGTVSNDTGLAHLSAAVGTPTVTVFGPTDPETTRPFSPIAEVVRHPVECSPCMLRTCPIDHRCMTRVEPAVVLETLLRLLSANR